jgi:hypothetical protein
MELINETCQQYFKRRLREGWKCIKLEGLTAVLLSPEGVIRPLDLRNDVETLRPNAAGDETSIPTQTPSSGYHWDKVDEASQDGSSTEVVNDTTDYQRDLYNLPVHSGSGTINFIKVYDCVKRTSAQGRLKVNIKTGGTIYEGSERSLSTNYDLYSEQWSTNPKTSAAWTWDDIDDLQIGANIKYARLTQVYVEVDYTAVTAKTSSDTGSGAESSILGTETAKSSSDTGSGAEATPLPGATLAGNETGSSLDAPVARLLAAVDTGVSAEAGISAEAGGLLKDLFADEPGQGSDSLTAKIEKPTKGGGMKLWM